MVGNVSNYEPIDILRVFLRINSNISRKELSTEVLLGEGSIKAILSILKKKKLIKSTRQGHSLSAKGKELLESIHVGISELKPAVLPDFNNLLGVCAVVKNVKEAVNYKQRDIAIRHGAQAALLFRFDKKLFLPQCEQGLMDTTALDNLFEYNKDDVLVVVFAESNRIAERAVLNVAIALSKGLEEATDSLIG